MLLNSVWMIGKNWPALALSSWTHRGVLQMLAEGGVAAAIAGKPVGQQMRIGGDIGFEEGPQLGPGRGRQHGDARIAGEEPVLAPDGVPMLSAPVLFGAGTFSTAATTRLLSGWPCCDR